MTQNYLDELNKYQLQKDVDAARTPNTYLDYFEKKDIPLPVVNNTIEGISQRVGGEMKTPYDSEQFTASGLTTTPTKIEPSIDTTVAAVPATPTNILQKYTPQTEYEKYWGQKVGPGEFKVPLNVLVGAAGKTAYALDPKGFGGILGKQLAEDADVATKEMARREYEGPNVLLQRRLHSAQAQAAESGIASQKAVGDYITNWPKKELSLKEKGITSREALDTEYIKGMIATIAPYSPEKAASLQEKMIEARENRKLREYAQDMKDYFNELKIDQAIANGLRAERTLEERKRHNKIIEKFRRDEITDKKAKGEEEKWYPLGLDPDTKKVVFTDRKGNTKLGDLPSGVKSVAPKTEKIPTERSKFTEDLYRKLRLKTINIERKQKGLPPLPELPDNESGTKPVKTTQWPEGTIIKNSAGKRMIMRNGKFVDYTEGES